MEDHLIIKGCKNGEETAFKLFVEKYAAQIMSICMRYLKDPASAKDAVQETLILVFKSIKQYKGDGVLGAWVGGVAVNVWLKEVRSSKTFADITFAEYQESGSASINDNLEVEDILKLINQMPETLRLVFNLNLIEGFSHLEISEMLGISESSSRVYLLRSRNYLKEKLTEKSTSLAKIVQYK
ncbi:MAG: RNA polymerase sigma factor [Saprospiraceae bacterium]|nr:RNA polymerase sigma factor [Saprospiraceae bacterium]